MEKKKELIILNLQDDTFEWRVNVACADMLLYSERDNKKLKKKMLLSCFLLDMVNLSRSRYEACVEYIV